MLRVLELNQAAAAQQETIAQSLTFPVVETCRGFATFPAQDGVGRHTGAANGVYRQAGHASRVVEMEEEIHNDHDGIAMTMCNTTRTIRIVVSRGHA